MPQSIQSLENIIESIDNNTIHSSTVQYFPPSTNTNTNSRCISYTTPNLLRSEKFCNYHAAKYDRQFSRNDNECLEQSNPLILNLKITKQPPAALLSPPNLLSYYTRSANSFNARSNISQHNSSSVTQCIATPPENSTSIGLDSENDTEDTVKFFLYSGANLTYSPHPGPEIPIFPSPQKSLTVPLTYPPKLPILELFIYQ